MMKLTQNDKIALLSITWITPHTADKDTLDKRQKKSWKKRLQKILHNWKTRSRLKTLNESQLKDLGLTAADVDHEVNKPLWK